MKKKGKKKVALITGITGQDGSYLAEFLLKKGYVVHGIVRRTSNYFIKNHSGKEVKKDDNDTHIHYGDNLHLHYGDLSDYSSIDRVVKLAQPDEVYNMAAMSDVRVSFDIPEYTADISGVGALRVIESVRANGLTKTKIYQASTSELYGKVVETPQTEKTPFYPRSPYAVAKQYAFWQCKNYREAYGMFICNGILFNHESPRRGPNFVTRKITMGIAAIVNGKQDKIYLGNIDSKRDWGYAPEYVEAMWMMLQQKTPDDFVLATGETHTVREFLEEAFKIVGLDWKKYVVIKKELYRPSEVELLLGNPAKAKKVLGWKPKVKFKELVKILVEHDLKNFKNLESNI